MAVVQIWIAAPARPRRPVAAEVSLIYADVFPVRLANREIAVIFPMDVGGHLIAAGVRHHRLAVAAGRRTAAVVPR